MAGMVGEAEPAGTPEAASLVGQLLGGKYRVTYLLGQGGMAAVWAGTNERTGKRVALKVIRNHLLGAPGAESFLHSEGLVASRINHPNVVTVFDVIEHEGMACIVMELLDGEPLGSYILRRGPLSVTEATSLLLPAMRGVAAAHAMGVIHRDLKPQNIFICIGPDGRVVTTKVLDFGISIIAEQARERSEGKLPGLMGTPSYMSPEHIAGDKYIDERADVYGFGVLLYEALTGKPPFPGEPNAELLRRVLREPAPPVTSLRPDLPPGLVRIIETAMAKQPDERYPRLEPMMSAIEDEIMPPTLPPRVPTPLGGVPASALSYSPSGQLVSTPPGGVPGEPAAQHQQTMVFFGTPLEAPPSPSLPGPPAPGGETDWDSRIKAVALLGPMPTRASTPASGVVPSSRLENWPTTETFLAGAAHPALRWAWRALVAVVILFALGFVVRTAVGVNRRVQTAAAVPSPPAAATPPEPAPAPPPAAAPSPAPAEAAAPAAAAPVPPAAEPKAAKASPPPRHRARPAPATEKPAHGAVAPAKTNAPRAGRLSADDF